MNKKSLWIASLSGAALSILVANLPFIGLINCFLCAGFWGSSIFAVWLYRQQGHTLSVRQGVTIGALTGLIAGLVGFALSFAGLAGAQGFINTAQQFLPADATKGMEDIPTWGEYLFNAFGVVFEVVFGAFGGWIGAVIFDPNRKSKKGLVSNEKPI